MRLLWFPIALIAALLVAQWLRDPPALRTASEPTAVSIANLSKTVTSITTAPHVAASSAQQQARDTLVAEFKSLGLQVETQSTFGVRQSPRRSRFVSFSPVENIVAVLPGRDRNTPAVALMAHYDSVPFSPGASDDASGTASVVEAARLLAQGPQPARDVIFLITDAEEQGLIGAQAFFNEHLLSAHIGAVVNVEARGSRGPATMFQTSPGNSDLVELWARHALHPSGNSTTDAIYRLLPNDTDLSVSLEKGKIGINAAFIDGQFDYHSPTDSIANLDPRTLQHLGDFAFTTTRALAMAETLPTQTGDSAYFDVFRLTVVRYPIAWGWGLIALALLGLSQINLSSLGTTRVQVAIATLQVAVVIAAVAASCHYLADAIYGPGIIAYRERLAEIDQAFWVYIALALGAMLLLKPRAQHWLGAMIVALLLAILAQWQLPGASWAFAWPLLIAIVLSLVTSRLAVNTTAAQISTALVGGATFAFALGIVSSIYVGIGALTPAGVALIILYALLLFAPAIELWSEGRAARGAGALLVAFAVVGAVGLKTIDGFSARAPRPADLFHITYADTDTSFWATTSTAAELGGGKAEQKDLPGKWGLQVWQTPAPQADTPRPSFAFTYTAGHGVWTVKTAQTPRVFLFGLRPSQTLTNVKINGKPIKLESTKKTSFVTNADVPLAVTIEFDAATGGTLDIDYMAIVPGWPEGDKKPPGPPTNWTPATGARVIIGSAPFKW